MIFQHSVCLFLLSFSTFFFDNISVNSMSSQCWNYLTNHVTVDPLEPNQLSSRSKSHSLGLAGSWWKFDKVILALKLTSWEDWSRFVLSLSGSLFANGFWTWGAWLWSATMETFLIGMNPSLLLTGKECDFLKLTTMSIIVPTRQRNRIKPHNILCKLIIKSIWGVLMYAFKRYYQTCTVNI